jgi:hypothetical protein
MDMQRQYQSSLSIAIVSLVVTVPALLYILAAIALLSYKAVTGYIGPYPLLHLGVFDSPEGVRGKLGRMDATR